MTMVARRPRGHDEVRAALRRRRREHVRRLPALLDTGIVKYFAWQAKDGEWHTVYKRPGTEELVSVCAGGDCACHIEDANNRNRALRLAARDLRDEQRLAGVRFT